MTPVDESATRAHGQDAGAHTERHATEDAGHGSAFQARAFQTAAGYTPHAYRNIETGSYRNTGGTAGTPVRARLADSRAYHAPTRTTGPAASTPTPARTGGAHSASPVSSGATSAAHPTTGVMPARSGAHRTHRVSNGLKHMGASAASSMWNMGADRTDQADTVAHTATEQGAKAAFHGGNTVRHGIGKTAGWASRRMSAPRRKAIAEHKARLKAERAKAKGKPVKIKDVKPSDKIGKLGKLGRASRRIGKPIVGKIRQVGSTGLGWADQADGMLLQADDDLASRIGKGVRTIAWRGGRVGAKAGVKGVTSSAEFIWRHRTMPVTRKTVHGIAGGARATVRAAHATSMAVRAIAGKIMGAVASMSAPTLPIVCGLLAVVLLFVSIMGAFLGMGSQQNVGVKGVPAEYEADVIRAGSICDLITPPVIAAQIEAESNWNPNAVSPVGATGIAQFMPGTWAGAGKDGDGDGRADINNPHDQIISEGYYMCSLADEVEALKGNGVISGDSLQLTIAAYNAGLGNVIAYGGIPPFTETRNYVTRILGLIAKYTAPAGGDGMKQGTLDPPMIMQADNYHVDIAAMGIPATSNSYQVFQCTWWAYVRRLNIGKPVDGYMGNGGDWNDSARRFGYPVSGSPQPGDVLCFEPGVHGSDPYYGHVAVVERVDADGSILISQSGRGWMSVVTETISAQELQALGNGISFIH